MLTRINNVQLNSTESNKKTKETKIDNNFYGPLINSITNDN